MAARSNWEGFIRLNLVSVPVRAYNATVAGRGKIGFHLIHKGCNSRIRYQKVCPIHGEVPKHEIVSGYEYAKGQYILVDPGELKALRAENDKSITIATFIHPDALDPIYYTERSYFLIPNGKVGQKPYAMLQKVMTEHERYALAQVVFAGREQLVLLRPSHGLLLMTMLSYDAQLKKPSAFEDEAPDVEISAKELHLAESLVEAATTEKFDFEEFQDTYSSRIKELIEAKAEGKKIVAAPQPKEPHIINMMDALRRSLDQVQKRHEGRERGHGSKRPPKPRQRAARRKTG